MAKTETKFYVCVHNTCPFETAKRKAIYTHLVRTHNERKEDYECEYCSTVFQDEQLVEDHLVTCHPDEPFTYTCVSRIENVINRCAKRGSDQNIITQNGDDNIEDSKIDTNNHVSQDNGGTVDNLHEFQNMRSEGYNRTRASVNESLNSLAARNEMLQSSPDKQVVLPSEIEPNWSETNDPASLIDKTGGLKMKLNLKMIAGCSSRDHLIDRSTPPPKLEPASPSLDLDSATADGSPPNIVPPIKGSDGVSIREKSSKYFDRLEVYHTTDEHGRRCCPFCPYKTTKNTIRVHLSGIHKIYFVKCSLCEYKAAFPHQVTQHGVKFHKTTHLNVIQLSKESREKTILKLNNFKNNDLVTDSNQSYNYSLNSCSTENSVDIDMLEEENFSEESSVISGDEETEPCSSGAPQYERSYKAPKSQMSKTDYFSIKMENGIHLYSCNLCPFKTPVRATIYTHKYRHEDKTYRCGYCDFISAPRSNVVHHLRSKHKDQEIIVTVVNEDEDAAMNTEVDLHPELLEHDKIMQQEQSASPEYVYDKNTRSSINDAKDHPTIIKVPQFKRTLTSVSDGSDVKHNSSQKRRKTGAEEYKLSLNKLYKVNPSGSPKYICVECDYGCDTHPKMKHHLYRHRPQQYKCPYCDHRKYPRSYVVRHVRDTHRDKPVRVIDLSIGPDPIDIPEYMEEEHEDDRADPNVQNESMDMDYNEDSDLSETNLGLSKRTIDTKTNDLPNDECLQMKAEPDDMYPDELDSVETDDSLSNSLNSKAPILNNVHETSLASNLLDDSNDVNPNFSEVVYTSTPLIESLINGQFSGSTSAPDKAIQRSSVFKKKSMKEYRINYGDGPKYICNICGYGTENYKTIHNHMYRHESQKYQCPYCGYRRSPKSFVENHIREVHRGHPLFVTELNDDLEQRVPLGSPRQCVMMKQQLERPLPINRSTKDDLNLPSPSKLQVKWPAPKPATQITVPFVTNTQTLQIPMRPRVPNASVVPSASSQLSGTGNLCIENGTNVINTSVLPPNVAPFKPSEKGNVLPRCAVPKMTGNAVNVRVSPKVNSCSTSFKFKEPSRTTFKTMYKCVFDPESCNHISKDKSKMKQHLFMHVEYKPWSCDLCEMTASQSSHIKNHVRTEHYGVSDMSFKYKKHNYLEKHIETFLTKGLFTVPVTEYRMIMDMKGNTKEKNRTTFTRDSDGFVMCPHCDYKTKSGSMTDHVKMKHMQPRFKCHWCTFKAFYRAEIRRHHRKEKGHRNLEFRIQELDLKEVAKEFAEGKTKETQDHSFETRQEQFNGSNGLVESDDDDDDDGDDDGNDDGNDEDVSSNEDLSDYFEYSTGKVNTLILQQDKPNSDKSPTSHIYNDGVMKTLGLDDLVEDVNVIGTGVKKSERPGNSSSSLPSGNAKFKCGYCSFSAALRVKVKMHCNKKHTGQELLILEPFITNTTETHARDNIMRVNCSELKGTKFEADLMKAGVSKLNLASLFPYRRNDRKHFIDRDPDIEDNDFDDESDEETVGQASNNHIPDEGNAQLIIPFKKINEPSKIELLASELSYDKGTFDVDNAFKKPMDPVSTNKQVDKRREPIESHRQTVCATSSEQSVKFNVCSTGLESSMESSVYGTSLEESVKSTVCGTSLKESVKSTVCHTHLEESVKSTCTVIDKTNAILFEDIVVEPLEVDRTEESTHNDILGEASMVKNEINLGRNEDCIQGIECSDHESLIHSNDTTDRNGAPSIDVSQTLLLTHSEGTQSVRVVDNIYDCSEMVSPTDESDEVTEDDTTISIPALDVDIDTVHSPDDEITDTKLEPVILHTDNGDDGILMDHDRVVDNIKGNDDRDVSVDTLVSMGNFTKSIVHTTYPCGSPVVLEADTEEEGQA